ncbi:MAG: hypothetical protein LBF83_06105 [Spirochaetaceae bacterium]|nr:hypothetical protein [Spirochaetaceae bacterium]
MPYGIAANIVLSAFIPLSTSPSSRASAAYHEMTTVIPASMRTPTLPSYPPITVYKSIYYDVGA